MRDHILVCLSSAPSNERIVSCAREMAESTGGMFTALYVETPDLPLPRERTRRQLARNVRLAEAAGARVETVFGEDVAYQIAEYVRLHHVTRVILGEGAPPGFLSRRRSVTQRLSALLPDRLIYVIPEPKNQTAAYPRTKPDRPKMPGLRDLLICAAMLAAATLIGLGFEALGFAVSTVISIYILGILLAAVLVTNYMSGALVSLLSVILFNFFFTEPKYTLLAYEQDYPVTFIVMFLVSILTCSLAERLKSTARQYSRTSFRTQVLFDTAQMLYQADQREQIFETTAKQLVKLLDRNVVMIPAAEEGGQEEVSFYPADPETPPPADLSAYTFFPIRFRDTQYGRAGVAARRPLEAFESSLLLSILGECALTLENQRIGKEKEEAAVRIQNEQFRSNLLRSISHDLRTPLTAISGNASNLLREDGAFGPESRRRLYQDIYDDSVWLTNLVENLLSVSRIEEGRIRLHREVELLDDVVDEALSHLDRHRTEHTITVTPSDQLLLVKVDARLIMQVLINLVNNAIQYTPRGSTIEISTFRQGQTGAVRVADDGPGVPAEVRDRVFEMFYSGEKRSADSRRGVGMGLALCRSIVQAHGGEIVLSDNLPHGAVFTFTLPLSEVDLHE